MIPTTVGINIRPNGERRGRGPTRTASEFALRHTQYEMFYAGAQFTTRGNSYRTYDWQGSKAMVERILDSYDLSEEVNRRKAAAQAAE